METVMTVLLQFCGLSDPLQAFYLEQSSVQGAGPAFAGFRPFQLDHLLAWTRDVARQRCWELETIQGSVVGVWMERAEAIRQWQLRLREEPPERVLVAGIGTQQDWERRCEAMLRA
jgi:hypothetical protein